MSQSQTTSLTKNITFSKAGITLVCHCGETDTYKIGQLDTDKWANEGVRTRHKYWCKDCRAKDIYTYLGAHLKREQAEIDRLMEMI